jgi:hypothetical protein
VTKEGPSIAPHHAIGCSLAQHEVDARYVERIVGDVPGKQASSHGENNAVAIGAFCRCSDILRRRPVRVRAIPVSQSLPPPTQEGPAAALRFRSLFSPPSYFPVCAGDRSPAVRDAGRRLGLREPGAQARLRGRLQDLS